MNFRKMPREYQEVARHIVREMLEQKADGNGRKLYNHSMEVTQLLDSGRIYWDYFDDDMILYTIKEDD